MSTASEIPPGGAGPSRPAPPLRGGWSAGANAVSAVGLGLLVWGVLSDFHTLGPGSQRTAAVVLLTAATLSWLAWMLLRPVSDVGTTTALAAMAVTGGALGGLVPVAMIFPAVAVLSTAMWSRTAIQAAAIGAAGWLAMAVSVLALDKSFASLLGGLAAILGGAVVGITRRQGIEHAEQIAGMEVAMARTEVERARAELLAERNHLAREIHDVLAHTLAALSLQLQAFHTVVDAEPETSARVREQLERTSLLVREGLEEARGAVSALRDEPAPLGDQLPRLSAQHGAAFSETGAPQQLAPPVVLGLYRVVQEALTNVDKHASGAAARVALHWSASEVAVSVENEVTGTPTPAPLSGSGGGYGLRGIAERLELLGGTVCSGPTPGAWRVDARVPLVEGTPVASEPAQNGFPGRPAKQAAS